MARHTLGFDRLETRQMLVADGGELMAASYDPLAVAGAASPASDVLASHSFLPRVQFSRVMEPINGVVYVMHYSGVWVKGDNDVQMFLGTSWWTTLPGTQGGGSQASHADEGKLRGSADEEPPRVSDAGPSERDLASGVNEPPTGSEMSDVEDSAALATGVIFALPESETAHNDDSPECPQDTASETFTETTEVDGVDVMHIDEITSAEAVEREAGDDEPEKLDVEGEEGMIADGKGVTLWGEESE